MNIEPKYLTVSNLLNNKLFKIPEYQRAYSWGEKQRADLFSDILQIKSKNENHFMATIVCMKTNNKEYVGSNELNIVEIVDGQQRLTTLIALLKAIEEGLDKKDKECIKEADELKNNLLVRGKSQLLLLQNNHDDARVFENYLKNGDKPDKSKIKTLSIKNLNNLFSDVERFIKEWKEKNELLDLLIIVKNRLGFIYYEIDSPDIVYTVFEVLNSRGLPVNYLDKSKSLLLGIIYDFCKNEITNKNHYSGILKNNWGEIYRIIGINDLNDDDIVKFSGTLLHPLKNNDDEYISKGKLLSCEESLETFKLISINADNVVDTSELILNISKSLKKLSEIKILRIFYNISQVRFLYVAIDLSIILNDNEKEEIYNIWEKVSFRIFGLMNKDSKKKVGDYIRLARDIYHNEIQNPHQIKKDADIFYSKNLKDKIIERIELIGQDSPIDKAIAEIKETNCYESWVNELIYFFYKYEEFLCIEKNIPFDPRQWDFIDDEKLMETIEHIFPQNPDESWKGKMGSGKNTIENNVHRLGNLLVLPKNINQQCGKKSFILKKEIYNKSTHFNYIKEIDTYVDWTKKEIDTREEKLLKNAKIIWA